MGKKLAVSIPIFITIIVSVLVTTIMLNTKPETSNPNLNNKGETMEKSAVVYFSQTNNTKKVAEVIKNKTNSDIFEIRAKNPYSEEDLDWTISDSRANLEQNDPEARPEIETEIDLSAYEKIYLGYPIWWGTVPKIINTFIETDALNGKEVVAFCTSGSSGIEGSLNVLKGYGLNVLDGCRFSASASENEISEWLKSL